MATAPFDNGQGLAGTVDYAVYTFAGFQAKWGGLGYNPTPGEDVYTYQVILNGTLPMSHLSVNIQNVADSPGMFALPGGTAPTTVAMGLSGVDYFFAPGATAQSSGLAFSSPNSPVLALGSLVGSGSTASLVVLPTPSAPPTPEPATTTCCLPPHSVVCPWRSDVFVDAN